MPWIVLFYPVRGVGPQVCPWLGRGSLIPSLQLLPHLTSSLKRAIQRAQRHPSAASGAAARSPAPSLITEGGVDAAPRKRTRSADAPTSRSRPFGHNAGIVRSAINTANCELSTIYPCCQAIIWVTPGGVGGRPGPRGAPVPQLAGHTRNGTTVITRSGKIC